MSVALLLFIPNKPETATFLSESDRTMLLDYLRRDKHVDPPSFTLKESMSVMLDWIVLSVCVVDLLLIVVTYSISFFLPVSVFILNDDIIECC
jgi:hypothetical protein